MVVDGKGNIAIKYMFSDVLDLRPDWGSRSYEYNAVCCVLGFLYHDVLGASDKLKIKGNWTKQIKS